MQVLAYNGYVTILKIIKKAKNSETISKNQKSNNDIYLVPAFTGLGAPYWRPDVRGIITGLTRNTNRNDIIRATLESVAYQTFDLLNSMRKDGQRIKNVKIDGGMVNNNWLCEFLSDILDIIVFRSKVHETTALGSALMAGYGIGIYKSLSDISKKCRIDKTFRPKMRHKHRLKLLNGWHQAIKKTLR